MSMLTPWRVNGNSKEEGGFKSLIFWNESMTLKWNFCRVGGFNLKIPTMVGVWIFSGTTHLGLTDKCHSVSTDLLALKATGLHLSDNCF